MSDEKVGRVTFGGPYGESYVKYDEAAKIEAGYLSDLAEAVRLLRDSEKSHYDTDRNVTFCWWCRCEEGDHHTPTCLLGDFLARMEKERNL